ncbi:ATP-binding cassette domain-containing protein [Microbacterium sp. Mu-80]|uniref:ATP-binding cassette domain-containing protein n=1 Tax=Microbacterium bandirmense TaxID=3122050 RepID=A0ABU8L9D0_9MICO
MPEGQVLEFADVTKRFNTVTAVSELSVRVEPGAVTGFLGPNGAGKTTSLRILLGQIKPTTGTATIGGVPYSELRQPLRTIGAVLEESSYRPRRTAARHLNIAAKANGIPSERVAEVLHLVGLQDDADTRLGSYSLGMRQRLAVATALLGDPGVLVLDEPANGLDPEGIRWMRLLMRRLADEGRTVLVSSHVLSEIEQVADNVVVLSRGKAVFSGSMDDLADPAGGAVVVDAEDRPALIAALTSADLSFDLLRSGVTVRNSDATRVGAIAAEAGIALSTLQQRGPSLEEVFLDLVYGRRGDSPRVDEVANPVTHPAGSADPVADAALVAGGVPLAGAAAVVADGGVVAAAGVGYGTAPIDIIPSGADADADADASNAAGETAGEHEATGEAADDADAATDVPVASETAIDHEAPLLGETPIADDASVEGEAAPIADADDEVDDVDVSDAWAPRAADAAASDSAEGDTARDDSAAAPASTDEDDAQDRPVLLPTATASVALPITHEVQSFTDLITGIPASTTDDPTPGTEAIPVAPPAVVHDDDDDSAVDDAEDDPRLAAMRTSLSSAASRFFDGPAPSYPYGTADSRATASSPSANEADSTPAGEAEQPDAPSDEQDDQSADQHHG